MNPQTQIGTKTTKRADKRILCLMCLFVAVNVIAYGATENHKNQIDVLHYSVALEPDIAGKSVKGTVFIQFLTKADNLSHAEFDCGDLAIDSVRLAGAPLQFSVMDHRLRVSLPSALRTNSKREIEVNYHGTPKRGIRFFPDREQVYTVFSTSQWMPCIDDPADKATLTFRLILPKELTA